MKGKNNNHVISKEEQDRRDRIAQWAFDTRPILGRFHLWLDEVNVEWISGKPAKEFTKNISFLEGDMERLFAVTGAVTSLGTKLFGRYGEGEGKPKEELNQVKKDADAISAYAMSESLWYLSRQLPENHAIMVCLGEGLMPKAGETPEMGSNPQLGFGRVYARPHVAKWLDRHVVRLLNDPSYGWAEFYKDIKDAGLTIWGAAIDTLENTSRFAKGEKTGPMTVLHLFNQPLQVSKPYEGYTGNLLLPKAVVKSAEARSVLINFRTPRKMVLEAIQETYPDIRSENIHVWTLGGSSRTHRIGGLWDEWKNLGAHIVEDGWEMPNGHKAFTDSGTYAPSYNVGPWTDENGDTHMFIVDGYAASAEAMQAASLAPLLNFEAFLAIFTSTFKLPYEKERLVMALDPDSASFKEKLEALYGESLDDDKVNAYKQMIHDAVDAGIPVQKHAIVADDFFPEKSWDVLAVSGYMCPDPYSAAEGVEEVEPGIYKVTVRLVGPRGDKRIIFKLRCMEEEMDQMRLVFSPLLNRFLGGEDYINRPVRISDSGRIRNELQTLASEALEFIGEKNIKVHFHQIPPEVISPEHQEKLRDILKWYKKHHPLWFSWLELD